MKAVDRLINYVKIETTSNPESNTSPTSANQFDMARVLKEELIELGVEKVILTDTCYVYAFIPSNVDTPTDKIGLIAHMDTAPDFSGKNVNPRIVEKYDGSDIILNNQRVLSKQRFTQLEELIGHDLLVTDGTTLLGADDKAGISVIMTLVEYVMSHPEFKHGDIRIAFTPDEEVGKGADHFD
ncbi:MAG: tripeptide aminopeptidase PepT, partial [Erysipelotrichaceae bacterium]|nr:tripeptide aminopeptidase PepT [Erysipelotrichaceae bacterium]